MNRFNLTFVRRACVFGAVGIVTIGAAPQFARADLGGAPTIPATATSTSSSLKAATVNLSAATQSTSTTYTVRTETLEGGTIEREYVSVDGVVFGVAWNGPFAPDFQKLFGTSAFTTYTSGLQAARSVDGVHGRPGGPVTVSTSGLIVQMGGHQRAFMGRAYMPDLLPSGMSAADIQ